MSMFGEKSDIIYKKAAIKWPLISKLKIIFYYKISIHKNLTSTHIISIKRWYNMCNEKEKEVPNMTLLAKPCKKAIIIKADKAGQFLHTDNKTALKRALERSKQYSHIITDNTKGKVN